MPMKRKTKHKGFVPRQRHQKLSLRCRYTKNFEMSGCAKKIPMIFKEPKVLTDNPLYPTADKVSPGSAHICSINSAAVILRTG